MRDVLGPARVVGEVGRGGEALDPIRGPDKGAGRPFRGLTPWPDLPIALRSCTSHDEHVRRVAAKRVQVDEIWTFVYAKEKNVAAADTPPRAPEILGRGWRSMPTASSW